MPQTKYRNNVIMTSVTGRKNEQIKTNETDAAGYEAHFYC